MAGKSNTSATFFAQKKLLGKAHTSNLKVDGEEVIGSNVQAATSLLFGEKIPEGPSTTDYVTSSAAGANATVEYIPFILTALTGTTYDANDSGGGAGSDSGESGQSSGPHAYKFVLPSNYEAQSTNTKAGKGIFNNDRLVHESLGSIQLVPPFFSQNAPNPYNVKIYKDNGAGGIGDEIPLLDNIDWNVDFYNGILFLQDYDSGKIPAFARAFAYIGKMADEVIASGSSGGGGGGGGSGDSGAQYLVSKLTGSLSNAKLVEAGDGIIITTGSNSLTIAVSSATINGREKISYFVTSSHASPQPLVIPGADYSTVAYDTNKIDILYNGQLLHSGSTTQVNNGDRDYFIKDNGSISFGFNLFSDDIVDSVINVVGESSGGGSGDSSAAYLVLSNTGSLSNERALVAGTGLNSLDAGANGNFTLNIDDSVVATLTSSATFANGITGSLTNLSDGSSYLVAGTGIAIITGSSGQVTISSIGNAVKTKCIYEISSTIPSGTALNTPQSNYQSSGYKPSLIDVYNNGMLMMSGTDSQVGSSAADYFLSGNNHIKFGASIFEGDTITVITTTTGSNRLSGGDCGSETYTAGNGLNLNANQFSIDNSVVATISGSTFSGTVISPAFSGSLTRLANGNSYLVAGTNVTIVTGSTGQVTISSTDTNTQLTQEQVEDFVGGMLDGTETGISVSYDDTDGNIDFVVADTTVAGDSGSTGITPGDTLTIAGGTNVTTAMSGDTLTINATDTNTQYTAGDGLDLGGTEFSLDLKANSGLVIDSTELSIDDSILATLSGSQFSGNVGITGTLGIESQAIFNAGIHEKFNTKTSATGVVAHDCSAGHIFYHTSLSADFTANFTNLNLSTTYGTNVTLVLVQGATARIPTAVQIGGAGQTILWQGGSAPSGTNNGTDVVSFSILNNSGTYTVLGQLVGFG